MLNLPISHVDAVVIACKMKTTGLSVTEKTIYTNNRQIIKNL